MQLRRKRSTIRTLDRGIVMFNGAAMEACLQYETAKGLGPLKPVITGDAEHLKVPPEKHGKPVISDAIAFQLHDTYGLYVDIVEQMA